MNARKWCAAVLMVTSLQGWAGSLDFNPSEKVAVGLLSIIATPVGLVKGSAEGRPFTGSMLPVIGTVFVVTGVVEASGSGVRVLLEGAKDGSKLALDMSKSAFQASGTAIGVTVQASATASGTLLVASGKVLAFIPNAVGEALLEHSHVPS
ncbi:hypothetical protein [Vogesella sp. LIG4]|uniref:hypothetical protein n=1 Tax=Vogesella sp. LIG4 TaxID=1192162 RepID=UPI00081FE9E3|nr:hypothetical protein [Vogesella sp. LIG4]SCK11008.1 hypothetical protein PSELUDRAFT_0888 [Vogesella sp. LIG4]